MHRAEHGSVRSKDVLNTFFFLREKEMEEDCKILSLGFMKADIGGRNQVHTRKR